MYNIDILNRYSITAYICWGGKINTFMLSVPKSLVQCNGDQRGMFNKMCANDSNWSDFGGTTLL